ncbi:MAG: cation transporter [Treponema sp.]|jgi:copper chaperone CopZ|nr:cation transporter [Treponema sp.]
MENITLKVTGMSCEHCVKAVNNALSGIAGVASAAVSLKEGTASFKHDPAIAPLETIKAAIRDTGFDIAN